MTVSERVANLSVNHDGFVFDPSSGDSYILNRTGLTLIQGLQDGLNEEQLADDLAAQFDVSPQLAADDVAEFVARLRTMQLL